LALRIIMASWSPTLFRWHRWFGYAVAWQVLAWVLGGALFAWLPFQGWVKAQDAVAPPALRLPAGWAAAWSRAALPAEPVLAVRSVATAGGAAWQLKTATGDHWLGADGQPLPAPSSAAVAAFARGLYRGTGAFLGVQRLAEVPSRWALVRELGQRRDVWVARFDDGLATRLYVDARSGELLAARNEAWVAYDFFWRLHVMDYADGEDFNNPWLRGASLVALGLVLAGVAMLVLALRRAWRRR
jgi:PepSY-associated TM region